MKNPKVLLDNEHNIDDCYNDLRVIKWSRHGLTVTPGYVVARYFLRIRYSE